MPKPWTSTFLKLAGLLAVAGVLGWIYGQVLVFLILAVTTALLGQIYKSFQLDRWLNTAEKDEMPAGSGIWPRMYAKILWLRTRGDRYKLMHRGLLKELRRSTNALPDGGVLLNEELEILYMNKAARSLLGLRRKRDRGQRIHNFVRHPAFVDYVENGDFDRGVRIPSPVLDTGWLAIRLVPYGREQRLLLIRDITRQQHVERMRRDFVANASHELRSPLTVITGYLDSLAEDTGKPDEWQQPLTEMQRQAGRMLAIVEDLLNLSRLETSQTTPQDREVDVVALLHLAKKEVSAMSADPRNVTLSVRSDAKIIGEQSEIQSVVSNLVSNAIRFTDQQGTIELSWLTDSAGGHLCVQDDGIGIAPEHIHRLTERFYRVDPGRARNSGGTGLGLAIVKHVLQRHDAELEIDSAPGHGSRFSCHFPPRRLSGQQRTG